MEPIGRRSGLRFKVSEAFLSVAREREHFGESFLGVLDRIELHNLDTYPVYLGV